MSLVRLGLVAFVCLAARTAAAQEAEPDGGVPDAAPEVDAAPAPDAAPPPPSEPPNVRTSEPEHMLVVPAVETGFGFGSYGRVSAGTDLRGGTPEKIAVVAHAPRIVEPSYVETDLYYRWLTANNTFVRTVFTLAFGDELFHYTGQFDAQPALRNLFLEASTQNWTFWAGSRMYRGDDIYLFDWWPLDDNETVGAGVGWHKYEKLKVDLHAGFNRLLDPFQYQTRQVVDPNGIGSVTVSQLDRQRTIASLSITHFFHPPASDVREHMKVKAYGEVEGLPSGNYRLDDASLVHYPRDYGLTIGGQVGWWNDDKSSANLFVRYSHGLTAFGGDLAAPSGLDANHAAWPASEIVVGGAANWNGGSWNAIGGVYTRRFLDADLTSDTRQEGWEYAADLRPAVKIGGDFLAGFDASYQVRFPRALSPVTLLAADPAVVEAAPMIIYAPMGKAAFDRPQLRLVWRIAHLNDAALDDYAPGDPRRNHANVYFLGAQAEWWFNSSTR